MSVHQSRTWQRKTIERAQETGTADQYRWYIEFTVPQEMRPTPDTRAMAATHPPGWIPVLVVGEPDPRRDPDLGLLIDLFKHYNQGRGMAFRPKLTNLEALDGCHWYDWGEGIADDVVVDKICLHCGGVTQSHPMVKEWRCDCGE